MPGGVEITVGFSPLSIDQHDSIPTGSGRPFCQSRPKSEIELHPDGPVERGIVEDGLPGATNCWCWLFDEDHARWWRVMIFRNSIASWRCGGGGEPNFVPNFSLEVGTAETSELGNIQEPRR